MDKIRYAHFGDSPCEIRLHSHDDDKRAIYASWSRDQDKTRDRILHSYREYVASIRWIIGSFKSRIKIKAILSANDVE